MLNSFYIKKRTDSLIEVSKTSKEPPISLTFLTFLTNKRVRLNL